MAMLTQKDLWSEVNNQASVPYDFINNKFDDLVSRSGYLNYELHMAIQQGKNTIEISKNIDKVGAEIDNLLFLYPHLRYR